MSPFRLLFVCTGNTCRSPMAEAIAAKRIADLGWSHVEIGSAGVSAFDGSPASDGAVRAAHERGLDLSGHASTLLTPERAEAADLILTMSASHLLRLIDLGFAEKTAMITSFAEGDGAAPSGAGVPDPIGGSDADYLETFRFLDGLIGRALHRLEPVVNP